MARQTSTATTGNYKHFLFIAAAALDVIPALSLKGFSGDSHPHPDLKPCSAKRSYAPPAPPKPFHGTGRNEKCPCGSGLKYKKCCGR